jgi:hypothetical protein
MHLHRRFAPKKKRLPARMGTAKTAKGCLAIESE